MGLELRAECLEGSRQVLAGPVGSPVANATIATHATGPSICVGVCSLSVHGGPALSFGAAMKAKAATAPTAESQDTTPLIVGAEVELPGQTVALVPPP